MKKEDLSAVGDAQKKAEQGYLYWEADINGDGSYLICTINSYPSASILGDETIKFFKQNENQQYFKSLTMTIAGGKESVKIIFLQSHSRLFYGYLLKFINAMSKFGIREIKKVPPQTMVVSSDQKHETVMLRVAADECKAFETVVQANQKSSRRLHSLIIADDQTLQLSAIAEKKGIKCTTVNFPEADCFEEKLKDLNEKQNPASPLELKNNNNKKPIKYSTNLLFLALGALNKLESLLGFLIRARMTEINLMISVMSNHEKVTEIKRTLLPKTAMISNAPIGTIVNHDTHIYTIGFNSNYLLNLLKILRFKPYLVKTTDYLLVYYAIIDHKQAIKEKTVSTSLSLSTFYSNSSQCSVSSSNIPISCPTDTRLTHSEDEENSDDDTIFKGTIMEFKSPGSSP